MKLNGRQVVYQDVEVAEQDIINATMEIVRKQACIGSHMFLKEGEVMMDDPDHRHGSIREITVRKATPEDVEAFSLLKQLATLRTKVTS